MGFDKNQLQQVSMRLRQDNPEYDVALADTGNKVYYALHPIAKRDYPTSAVVELIQALNQHGTAGYNDRVLRDEGRVYHTAPVNEMDREMARMNGIDLILLSAKKLPEDYELPLRGTYTQVNSGRWTEKSPLLAFADCTGGPAPAVIFGGEEGRTLDRLYMMAVFSLVTSRFVRKYQGHADADIGGLLVSPVGEILAWSVNTKEHNSTCHAEVNLLQSYFRNTSVPGSLDGARLYTTLKPCRMCAGMIRHAGKGKLHVLYGQGDPGEDAQDTVLDGTGRLHPLDGGNPGMKPVMALLKGPDRIYGKANLLSELEQERERKKSKGTIATTLSLRGSRERMRGAVRALHVKIYNYSDEGHGKANVRRVLGHIEPFLTRHGAHPDQIIDVSEYLYGDAEAVPYNRGH